MDVAKSAKRIAMNAFKASGKGLGHFDESLLDAARVVKITH
jgi:hypothetical protein